MENKNGVISFLGLLQIVLIILKVTNIIGYEWYIILIPLWFWIGKLAFILLLSFILWLAGKIGLARRRRKFNHW